MAFQFVPRIWALVATAAALLGFVTTPLVAAAAQELTVYTTAAPELLRKYREDFTRAHPGIDVRWVRDSTGVITSRLLAEKENPQADMIYSLAVTSLIALDREGMLLPNTPKDYATLESRFKDRRNDPPHWVGEWAFIAEFCFNTVEAKKRSLPRPASWQDLLKPVYKGQIVMPNPASSGTGYITVASWLRKWGEEAAWKYMDALHQNIAHYDHSGARPCTLAAQGEFTLGIAVDSRGVIEKSKGAPIDIILPEFIGSEMVGSAIPKGTRNMEAAKKFADWAASHSAHKLYYEIRGIVARPEVGKPPKFFPEEAPSRVVDPDVYWEVDNRDRIIAEWTRRYDSKSTPKN